jgi:hypothetical protein
MKGEGEEGKRREGKKGRRKKRKERGGRGEKKGGGGGGRRGRETERGRLRTSAWALSSDCLETSPPKAPDTCPLRLAVTRCD